MSLCYLGEFLVRGEKGAHLQFRDSFRNLSANCNKDRESLSMCFAGCAGRWRRQA